MSHSAVAERGKRGPYTGGCLNAGPKTRAWEAVGPARFRGRRTQEVGGRGGRTRKGAALIPRWPSAVRAPPVPVVKLGFLLGFRSV